MRKFLSIIFVSVFLFHSISAPAAEKIVILPFASLAKEDISFIQGVIPKLLSSRLSEMTGWEAVSAEATTADEAVKKYGPAYLVSGSVTKLGETYSLDIILRDPAGEKVGGYYSMAKDENGILASLEGLAKDLVKSLPGIEPIEEEVAQAKGEAEAADANEQPAGAPPPSAEQKSAEQEVAAIQPEAVSERKEDFTGIKKIKTLGNLPGEIYGVAAADIDGDGSYEIAFMGMHNIYLYRFREGEIYPTLSFEKGEGHHFLRIDVFDVDKDGREDFVVTDLVGDFLSSFVVGDSGEKIKIKIDKIPWFLSVFDDYKGERRLIGQGTGGDESPYDERAYVTNWDGENLSRGERVAVPRNEELVMGIVNTNAFSDDGKQRFIFLDQYEKLRLADEEAKIFWKSGTYYSGALNFFEVSILDVGLMEKPRFYVKGRVKRVVYDNKTAFLLREAPPPVIGVFRSYPWSRIVLLEWDGEDLVLKVEGDKENKLITDFAFLETGDGKILIVSPVVISERSLARKGKSKVVLFELVRGEVTN